MLNKKSLLHENFFGMTMIKKKKKDNEIKETDNKLKISKKIKGDLNIPYDNPYECDDEKTATEEEDDEDEP